MRVYDSTQIHNLSFSKKKAKKPTCLILDEIDGAMDGPDGKVTDNIYVKNAIKAIMDFIKYGKINKSVTNRAKTKLMSDRNKNPLEGGLISNELIDNDEEKENKWSMKNNEDEEESTPNKSQKNGIRRPIICICNDLYAKVLVSMRKEALVFNIKRANPQKLLQRLKEICIAEQLKVDTSILRTLCEKTNFDIRSCVNTLQFISYDQANISLLKSMTPEKLNMLGSKDLSEGIFEVMKKLFSPASASTSFRNVLGIYDSFGEFDRINEGLFVNYPKYPNKENDYINRAKLLEMLSFNDIISNKINSRQMYELSRYQAIPGAFAKKRYSTHEKPNLEFPTVFFEYKKQKKVHKNMFNSMRDHLIDEVTGTKISIHVLATDVLPYVHQLLQPEIKEITPDLLNKNEHKLLQNCVNLMNLFAIKLQDAGTPEEGEEIVFEPNIKKLLSFDFVPEINRLTMKRKMIIKSISDQLNTLKKNKKDTKTENQASKAIDRHVESNRSKLNNFHFGQRRTFSQFSTPESRFVYKFNEGVTNSVRRPLPIAYFLK